MFTGIVQAIGSVAVATHKGADLRLAIDAQQLAVRVERQRLAIGESIAVNGVCLTVVGFADGMFDADVSRETLRLTTLGSLASGDAVNLEAALRAGDPLGGHLMSGHVDGIARVLETRPAGESLVVRFEVPNPLAHFIAPKGSVALDGVSLTVNEVEDSQFTVNLIPHTLQVTSLGQLAPGQGLNLEVDMLARYVRRALQRQ